MSGFRDFFVLIVVMGSLPLILSRPFLGVLMWSWLSYLNPHKLSWGFAREQRSRGWWAALAVHLPHLRIGKAPIAAERARHGPRPSASLA